MSSNNVPPPPPDGFSDPFATDIGAGQTLDQGAPAVAAAPSRVFIILGLVVAVITFLMFNLFVVDKDKEAPPSDEQVEITRKEEAPEISDIDTQLAPPPPPDFTPPPIPEPQAPPIEAGDDGPTNELLRQRIRSSMLISGGGGLLPDLGGGDDATEEEDPNLSFAGRVYRSNTKAQKVMATHIGNLRTIVAQGKIIHAVLETAINTDLPGSIRAIVSRDIFPEAGDYKIIPKGSRLIGQYNSSVFGGQQRVYVVWTRLIRPDGVDVMINSPLIDQIGQAGVTGQVDTKFTQIFSRALLTSVVTIAMAGVVDNVNGSNGTSTTRNSDGSTTTSGDATSSATIEASQRFGSVAEGYLRRFINVQPTILVDQGTPVNVFVNRDLIFPSQFAGTQFVE